MLYKIPGILSAVIFVGIFMVCYLKSKGKYDDYTEGLDKKEHSLKEFIPLGLWYDDTGFIKKILPKMIYAEFAKYYSKIMNKIIELNEIKYSQYYYKIHMGERYTYGILVSAVASLFACIMAVQGDYTNSYFFAAASVITFFAIPFLIDTNLDKAIQKRRFEIQLEFPEFVNKLILLVNAGMTISKAFEKIVKDNQRENALYTELKYAIGEIGAGKPEAVAYEEFARRCKIKEVIKFISVIVLNLKKGGAEIIPTLQVQATECWEMRKATTKQLGEEASTKILFPLMIMMVGIIVIVATPAILSFAGVGM